MRVGVTLPSMGHLSQPDNLIQAAKAAEQLGYDTLWVADRLLYPVKPRTKYPVTADGSLPQVYKRVLDPLDTLTFVAAHTTDRLGHERPRHSLLQPGHPRAPIDHVGYLSNGRLRWFRSRLVSRRRSRHFHRLRGSS